MLLSLEGKVVSKLSSNRVIDISPLATSEAQVQDVSCK